MEHITNNRVSIYEMPIRTLSKVCLRTNHRVSVDSKLYCSKIMPKSLLRRIIGNNKKEVLKC